MSSTYSEPNLTYHPYYSMYAMRRTKNGDCYTSDNIGLLSPSSLNQDIGPHFVAESKRPRSSSRHYRRESHRSFSSITGSPYHMVSSRTGSPASHYNNNLTGSSRASSNYSWLVFMNEKWVPFDVQNQLKLEQTLTLGGTFVDICDSHFPDMKRVRAFPKNNYLSYLGVKYRLSRIVQPDVDVWVNRTATTDEA